jgi:hypothetical protein
VLLLPAAFSGLTILHAFNGRGGDFAGFAAFTLRAGWDAGTMGRPGNPGRAAGRLALITLRIPAGDTARSTLRDDRFQGRHRTSLLFRVLLLLSRLGRCGWRLGF